MQPFERDAVIAGVGISEVGRRLERDPWALTAHAALAAIADAGLDVDAIDGIATYPGGSWHNPGLTGAGVFDVARLLGIDSHWHSGGGEGASQLGSVFDAAMAVSSGAARHVLCFRSVWESTYQIGQQRASVTTDAVEGAAATHPYHRSGYQSLTQPYGVGYVCEGALLAQRYFYEHGATREQLAQVALVARRNAAENPDAVYREPMTRDDYFNARMISTPLCLFDCDVPVDGAIAFVVSRRSAVGHGVRVPLTIEAIGSGLGMDAAAQNLWSRTRLTANDVDIAQVYDGWSILALLWLEALGLCDRGGAGAFVEGGGRIALDGELPVNTGGGQLSAGRLHGYLQLYEACVQLRGEGGGRQVAGDPRVAIASAGAGSFTGTILVTNRE